MVEGYLSGLNASRRVGTGMEFSQYRAYEPGDDLRLLDWKMLARSGRHYVKQSELDTHITVKFILDASKSMLHTETGISKLEYAKVVIAVLAKIAQNQGDKIGLFAMNDQNLKTVLPVLHKQQYSRFAHELIQVNGAGKWPSTTTKLDKFHDRSRKELLLFITDFYEDSSELTQTITSLKTPKNELVVIQIMGAKELEFNYNGYLVFEDLETKNKVKVNAKAAKRGYLNALQENINNTRNTLFSEGIAHHLFKLDDPIAETISLFLKQRRYLM